MLPLSLVVITKNEAHNIARCLNSVPFAAEKIVLDSLSTDKTVEIAKSCGAQVFQEEFRGFRDQKQRACELAKNDWVLSLDADEALSPELADEVQELLSKEPEFFSYEIPRLSWHMGRWIHHGGWYPDRQTRLFHRKHCRWEKGHVHEKVQSPNCGRLQGKLHHFVFDNLSDQIRTNNIYSSLGAKDLFERGERVSVLQLLHKPFGKFIETYVLKRGFLDGMPGFIIAVGAAYSMFLKYAKLWELQHIKMNVPK